MKTKQPTPEVPWAAELGELDRRKALARQMGGTERVERQRKAGRLTVRERIDRLLDAGTFQEIGSISGAARYAESGEIEAFLPANCVFGRGRLDGRPVVVEGDDFTVRGGSADAAIWTKMLTAENMATAYRLPIVRLLEGSGGGGSVKTIETTGRANLPNGVGLSTGLHLCAANMAVVPVVAMGLGAVAGLGAARLAMSHYSIVVKSLSSVFVAGPPVVAALGEERSREDLGGWKVQTASGSIDHAVDTEEEAFDCARRFLSYLPSSVYGLGPRVRNWDPVDRRDELLASIVPREPKRAYNSRRIVETLVDAGSFFEMGRDYGRAIVTGLARLDGWPVALMAGDPLHGGGAWGSAACQKIVRFLDFAETFHLPVVHLVDCPGFQVGLAAEQSGLVRHGVRALAALNQTTVPWCSVIIRNVYGVGGGGHQPHGRQCLRYAWPSASWGSLPLSGGVEAAYRAEIDAAADPEAKLAEIEARLNRLRSPFRTAEAFWVEEIIDPRDTRRLLCEFANLAAPCRTPGKANFAIRP
jgi:acetyl-CoA carboxylase carboxyltransferase component